MSQATSARSPALERLVSELSTVSATRLVSGMQKVTRAVLSEGAVVVTRHDEPTMVLMSIESYLKLKQAAEPDLEGLTRRFDDMFARMQAPQAADSMADALAMTADELGHAAVLAAKEGPPPN